MLKKVDEISLNHTKLENTYFELLANNYHGVVLRFETINFGVCVPSSCSREELNNILKNRKLMTTKLKL